LKREYGGAKSRTTSLSHSPLRPCANNPLARKSENWLALRLINEMGSLVVHKVPREGGWYIDGLAKQSTDLMKPGCYVFACRSPGGSLPIYVGQAAKNIFDEAFNDRNVKNVNNYLSHRLRGKIEIYIICMATPATRPASTTSKIF